MEYFSVSVKDRLSPIFRPKTWGWRHLLGCGIILGMVIGTLFVQQYLRAGSVNIITVTTNADEYDTGAGCSLREAITAANTDTAFGGCSAGNGVDKIVLPGGAGNYNLTHANSGNTNEDNNLTGDLDINSSMILQGSGVMQPIIQAGTSITNGIDKVFSVNPLCTSEISVTIDNVVIRHGYNTQPNYTGSGADNGFAGGGLAWCGGSGGGNFMLSNATIMSNTTVYGQGGGLSLISLSGYTGSVTITNVIFQGNQALNGTGGGLDIQGDRPTVVVTGSTFTDNHSYGDVAGGGGIFIRPTGAGNVLIRNTTVSGNTSDGFGGGIYAYLYSANTMILIDQGSRIASNITGGKSGTPSGGGGIYLSGVQPTNTPIRILDSLIMGNSEATGGVLQGGGGLYIGTANVDIQYSRIVSNISTRGSGIYKDVSDGVVSAGNNWWGCSSGPTAAPCDLAVLATGSTGSLVSTPYLRLRAVSLPASLKPNQTSVITASFSTNSAGDDVSSHLDRLIGLPVTWSATGGTLTAAQSTIDSSGVATATYLATGILAQNKIAAVVDNDATTTPRSNVAVVNMSKAATTLTIVADDPDPSRSGEVVTVFFSLTGEYGNSPTVPTGSITVTDGVVSHTCALPTISCTITPTIFGNRVFTVQYSSDLNFNSSSNTTVHQVLYPPTVTKAFGVTSLGLNKTTTLDIVITNPTTNSMGLGGLSITDTLPAGLVVSTPNGLTNSCGGTVTATAGSSSIALSNGSVAVGDSCVIQVDVTGTTLGVKNNTTGNVSSVNGGTGGTASASITVIDNPIVNLSVQSSSPTTLGAATYFTATITGGSNVTYQWNFGDGLTGSGQTISHTYMVTGSYTARVTATNSLSSAVVTTIVTVTNLPPVPQAGEDQSVAVSSVVTLSGSASTDPDGHLPLTYRWIQTGGPIVAFLPNLSVTTFTAPAAPTVLTFTLMVTDARGLPAVTPDTIVVTVNDIAVTGLKTDSSTPTTLGATTYFTAVIDTGSNVIYQWNFGDGQTATGSTTNHVYMTTGTYTARVTATNGAGSVFMTTVVNVTNLAPIAQAGTDRTVTVGAVVTLNGNSSNDPDGHTPLTYYWTQTGGPAVAFSPNVSVTAFTAPLTPNVLTFTLTVTDARGLVSTPDTIVVRVNDVVIAGLSAVVDSPTTLGGVTRFTATLTAGSNVNYQWNFGDGQTANSAMASHTYAAAGTYTAYATATNSVSSLSVTRTVVITNLAPLAKAGIDHGVPVDASVTLDGSASNDPDGHTPLTYYWAQTGGPAVSFTSNLSVTSFVAPSTPAVLTFTLTVTDAWGLVSTPDTLMITVHDVAINNPHAVSDAPTTLGATTHFTGSVGAGTNVVYRWNFGDGQTASGMTASHIYAAAGTYTVLMTATNGLNSVSTSIGVNIGNQAPIADAGSDQTVVVGAHVDLSGDGSSDPDGHLPLTYFWLQTGGPAVNLNNPTHQDVSFNAPDVPSVMTFTLTVTDARGLASTADSVAVHVGDIAVTGLTVENDSPTTLGQVTTFTATVAAGSNVIYSWDFGDGETATGATVTHTYGMAESYTAHVVARNNTSNASVAVPVFITNMKPIAVAGQDQDVTIGNQITLNASGSSDPDGHLPLTYRWTQTGGPYVSFNRDVSITTFLAPATPGILTFILEVTDARGLTSDSSMIVVRVGDVPISGAIAGNDSPTTLGLVTHFNVHVDQGTNVVYQWNFGDGRTGSGPMPSHLYPTVGIYTVIMTATNSRGSVTATTPVTITNLAPIAIAGEDQDVSVETTVTLDGSGSVDPDFHLPLTYRWTQTGGPPMDFSANLALINFTVPPTPTVLNFSLTVTDSRGMASAPDQVTIMVGDLPVQGLQVINDSPTTIGMPTLFTATIESGNNVSYTWDFGDGETALGATAVHTYSEIGFYTATVTATNSMGSLSITSAVTINGVSIPITGVHVFNSSPSALGSATYFTASVDEGNNVIYRWNFGDGKTGIGVNVSHVYTATGSYSVIVTASNNLGGISTTTRVTITDNQAPVAQAGEDLRVAIGGVVTLTGHLSSDPDGHLPLTYYWAQTGGATVTFTPGISRTYFTAPMTTTVLTFTLTVTDALGKPSTPDTVVVWVGIVPRAYLPIVIRNGQ